MSAEQNDERKWKELHGREPDDFGDAEFCWLCDKHGEVTLTETWGCFEWGAFTHYLLDASIVTPPGPK